MIKGILNQSLLRTKAIWVVVLLLLLSQQLMAQNPFDLTPRLPEPTTERAKEPPARTPVATEAPQNPFDLIKPEKAPKGMIKLPGVKASESTPKKAKERNEAGFRLGLVLFILSMLAFLLTILRNVVNKSISGFLNVNLMNQLFREQEIRGVFPFLFLYSMFLINLGIFIFLSLEEYGIQLSNNQFTALSYCVGGVFGIFIGKHLLLGFVAYVFPINKEISRHNFAIIIFGIIIGLVLVPSNLLLTFGPENLSKQFIYITSFIIGLLYVYRYFRSLSFSGRFLVFHKFHFLLYICTIEIIPALIILKLILDKF